MAVSEVQIARQALSLIGNYKKIESFSEPTPEASSADNWYNTARSEMLERADWGFARKHQALAAHPDGPVSNFTFRYEAPADLLAPRYIVNPAGQSAPPVPFRRMLSNDGSELTLLTDAEKAELIYTADVINPLFFSPTFKVALAHRLAYYMTFDIKSRQGTRDRMFEFSESLAERASANVSNQEQQVPEPDAVWISGR